MYQHLSTHRRERVNSVQARHVYCLYYMVFSSEVFMSIEDVVLVSVPVADQERSKEFYTRVLGFELVRDDSSVPGIRWISVKPTNGRIVISLVNWFETMPAGSLRGLVLRSKDLKATYAELSARGVQFESLPEVRPWGTEAVFRDPDGNSFVVQQA
jgi:catechol 2,3-dioxygenase-like lactoylglutathione lyase family enzyme